MTRRSLARLIDRASASVYGEAWRASLASQPEVVAGIELLGNAGRGVGPDR